MKRSLRFDPSLYLVTDPVLTGDRSLPDLVGEAVAGGVSLVQLRDKTAPARDLLDQASALKMLLDPLGIPLIVNDRVEIAAAAGVGCHIGQTDLPPAAARGILGDGAIIGLSIDHPDQTMAVDPAILDYVAHGPFAATSTKDDAGTPVGMAGISKVRAQTALPLVAIGGLGSANAAAAINAGADGIAVVSAIFGQTNPRTAAESLKRTVDQALKARKEEWA